MWCEHCQTDVATVVAEDGQALLCTTCGEPTRKIVAPSLHPETKSAREFLERWAREQQALKQQKESESPPVSPQQPATPAVSAGASNDTPAVPVSKPSVPVHDDDVESEPPSNSQANSQNKTRWRVDNQHTAPSGPVPGRQDRPRRSQRLEKVLGDLNQPSVSKEEAEVPDEPETPEVSVAKVEKTKRKTRIDASHTGTHAPHFDTSVNAPRKSSLPGRMEAMWGQLMAYLGVGLLTVGTVFVLWGYFGDIERYASTGWLVATAGQMLLLLGIVTLVGGGMQQTTHEVSQRIEHLGGRIIRIEQSTDKILKGPHFRRSKRRSQKGAGREQDAA